MTTSNATTRTLVLERELPHSPEKVWRALTEGALIEQWLMKNDFQPVVGRKFTFRTAPQPQWNGIVDGEILIVEPCERLSYAWNTSEGSASELRTVVTWTLTPTEAGVRLRLEHSGFRPEEDANYQGASYGWQRMIGALERVVAALV